MRGEDFFRKQQCGCQCLCVFKSSWADWIRNLTETLEKSAEEMDNPEGSEVLSDDSCARCLRAVRFTNGYGKLRWRSRHGKGWRNTNEGRRRSEPRERQREGERAGLGPRRCESRAARGGVVPDHLDKLITSAVLLSFVVLLNLSYWITGAYAIALVKI